MNERLSRLVAAWLAHPTGIIQAVIVSGAWLSTPLVFGWRSMTVVFWYLAYCTFISFATQFTLAFQNKKAERAMVISLRNQTDTMTLLVKMATEERDAQAAVAARQVLKVAAETAKAVIETAASAADELLKETNGKDVLSDPEPMVSLVDSPLAPEKGEET